MKRTLFRIGKFHNHEKFNLWLGLCKCKLTEMKVHEAYSLQFLFTQHVQYIKNDMFINSVYCL